MHGWEPAVIDAVGVRRGNSAGISLGLLRPDGDESPSRPASCRTDLRRKDDRSRRADDVGDAPDAVRRHLRVGDSESLIAAASYRDRPSGLRRQRRQRPDDPAALLVSLAGLLRTRGQDLPGLGSWLSPRTPRSCSPATCPAFAIRGPPSWRPPRRTRCRPQSTTGRCRALGRGVRLSRRHGICDLAKSALRPIPNARRRLDSDGDGGVTRYSRAARSSLCCVTPSSSRASAVAERCSAG